MINLLPDQDKAEIRAGRANNILIRYVVAIAAILVVMAIEFGGSYYMIDATRQRADAAIAENQANSQDLIEQQATVTEFRNNLATTKQILDKQVDYSQIILRIASSIPGGVIIDQLSLDSTTFNTETTLSARAKNEATALRLKDALDASPYFTNVYFNTITIDPGNTAYPQVINLSVTYTQELTK